MSTVIRTLFLLLMALPSLLLAQNENEQEPMFFVKSFGEVGEAGSFRARFSREGAGVVWMQATDHYVTAEQSRKDKGDHETGEFLLLMENSNHALRLFNNVSEVLPVDLLRAVWASEQTDDSVKFTLELDTGIVLEKVIRHDPAARGFTIELTVRNRNADAVGNLSLALGGPALINPTQSSLFGDVSVAIAAPIEGDSEVVKPDLAASPIPSLNVPPQNLAFAGSTNRFFGAFVYPLGEPARMALTQLEVDTLPPRTGVEPADRPTTRIRYGLNLAIPKKGEANTINFGLYIGPKSYRVFETLPKPELFAPILEVDLNPPCCGGITIPGGRPMAKLLLSLLGWFHDVLGNWGFAIILLTFLVRGAMSPINFHMQKSMRAYGSKMAKLKPQMDALKAQYADDQKGYQQAMIQFQREHKIMPPIGGCLPIFLTMPIYIGLFTALRTAYDLRHQPFAGWIDDLSSSDALFQLGFWPDDFNLLPLLWIGMFVFMTMRQPLPTDPQQRQMQSMMRFMPLLFGVMLYSYASALLLYMVTSMVWSLIESRVVKKVLGPMDPNAGMMAPTPM